ncbi:MAG: S8 family serine peptidase [Methyloceanibacter sp.]|uniref:S8 family serine peptidase n=1 Tax=Methyloceanibacter sp. TaxID=1965321 RepID=UPI003D6D87C1
MVIATLRGQVFLGEFSSHPVLSGNTEEFPPDRLIVDLVYQSILNLRFGHEPNAPKVLIVNVSLGNRRKPFDHQISAWARLLDRMAIQFGILFVVSAGNHDAPFLVRHFNGRAEFEDAEDDVRSRAVVDGLGMNLAQRRLLSPGETVNGLTIGALHHDSVPPANRGAAGAVIDPFPAVSFSNCSSALGPGFQTSVKPDVLFEGSRERLIVMRTGGGIDVRPTAATRIAGIKTAAPSPLGNAEGYTGGTSAAAAIASRTAHRIHDALQAAYGAPFLQLAEIQRAVLLKALMVHPAAWPADGAELIREVLGPADSREHVRQRDNIRRFFGYGSVDPDDAVACAADRATFWAVGELGREELKEIRVPIPVCLTGQARIHSMSATLAWFTPIRPGQQTYRTVRLRLLDPTELDALRISTARRQPDANQSARGTVIHRRWEGDRAPAIPRGAVTVLSVQRELDRGVPVDEPVPFGLAVTITMPGENRIYEEVLARVRPRPRIQP